MRDGSPRGIEIALAARAYGVAPVPPTPPGAEGTRSASPSNAASSRQGYGVAVNLYPVPCTVVM